MPHPTAPMLQAEYHNYEHSSFNDYYGGFEPKQSTWNAHSGPRRVDVSISKGNSGCSTCGIHIISALVVIRSVLVLFCAAFLWTSGYQQEPVLWIAAFEAVNLFACILMTCGMECSNPFFCILFTVIRTVETVCALVFVLAFGWAVYDPQSDPGRFIKSCVVEVGRQYQHELPFKANWDDIAYQLSIFLCLMALLVFSISFLFTRCAWCATLSATDERRRRQCSDKREVSRVMVASDELYPNY